ncbi:hypothetical protein A3H80_02780 [Candidatus Roizmanbacteria bacterium RIFCSPLOWO2_02_FULL_37_19]|uniref:Uncharacterized protein n=1 Tax=Candidatus Roizmanbacteria bacterium RIFCSPHIGHO2_02_FULL_37_24 TaxID=1802037 RepID=A0A1F7GUY7_9BACT|nr:MAG: hypothetical protein A2862_00940 [Candidatus Roizmanbacteria bacterium RIFCSPHIGHO2_01_FULL_38_41]OGK22595.1 MAG: hypothetical protein A3C24_04680 [Candidatus Roizmanbacteria bacterium RIFCSPHIGHO2_02_FULL_37_24]OGK32196.1 MAG: hypothetical protein A3E10_03680 [Candidatus Roizmanbacteria bacterium RIFCSPHIGHO2_12_FULL_37_23]OGK44464.1 MAG: hypothetical protein A2956_01325 [Candidatus Roizmanbacteria bacterium RIFCSPLOWO2_01_FULL_37_57]OGK53785.1 MAG: hypothetical protein A3H80_02780 [Ca
MSVFLLDPPRGIAGIALERSANEAHEASAVAQAGDALRRHRRSRVGRLRRQHPHCLGASRCRMPEGVLLAVDRQRDVVCPQRRGSPAAGGGLLPEAELLRSHQRLVSGQRPGHEQDLARQVAPDDVRRQGHYGLNLG